VNLTQILLDLYERGEITIDAAGNGHASDQEHRELWRFTQQTGAFAIVQQHHLDTKGDDHAGIR
jgi:hypothetical protein